MNIKTYIKAKHEQHLLSSLWPKGHIMKGEPTMAQETKINNKPEKKFKIGCVTATIWKNEIDIKGTKIDVRNVNLEKSYLDKDGEWKNTTSLKSQDVPKAVLALEKAYEYCNTAHDESDE